MIWWFNPTKSTVVDRHAPVKKLKSVHRLNFVRSVFEDPDTLSKRLLLAFGKNDKPVAISGPRVLLVGFDARESAALGQMFNAIGVTTIETVACLNEVPEVVGDFTHLIVNADAFRDVDDAVASLLPFRKAGTDCVVILTSHMIGGGDLGSERLPICDVTLKYPVSLDRLAGHAAGIVAASATSQFSHNPSERQARLFCRA